MLQQPDTPDKQRLTPNNEAENNCIIKDLPERAMNINKEQTPQSPALIMLPSQVMKQLQANSKA